jgi:hypothetical protein
MILATAVILLQMQALSPKAGAAVASRQEAVTYAENIPAPAPFGAFSPIVPASGAPIARPAENGAYVLNLPDNDGTKTTSKPVPVLPDANTQILSGVYVPDHFEPLPPLPDKHYGVVKSGADKRLSQAIAQSSATTFNRALRRLKIARRSTENTRAGNPEGDSLSPNSQILLTSQ